MKIQSPWMGRFKGSAGNMTGCKVYDKNVMRAKAFEVSNPKTTAQKTQRSFFAQVADCCASVSEEQLRTLFGVKPKGMSRRNALTKQVSNAYSIDGTSKTLDFSKLLAIGNGEKVKTQIFHKLTNNTNFHATAELDELGPGANEDTSYIAVIFDVTKQKIIILNQGNNFEDGIFINDSFTPELVNDEIYGYITCAIDYSNTYEKPFGTFTIKTRAAN